MVTQEDLTSKQFNKIYTRRMLLKIGFASSIKLVSPQPLLSTVGK